MTTKSNIIDSFDEFTTAYIHCALWAENDDNGEQFNSNWKMSDFSVESLLAIKQECEEFQKQNSELLDQVYNLYPNATCLDHAKAFAGHDYWLSRNGHGTGYCDRELGDIGEQLHDACKYQPRHIYSTGNELEYCRG